MHLNKIEGKKVTPEGFFVMLLIFLNRYRLPNYLIRPGGHSDVAKQKFDQVRKAIASMH